MRYLASIRYDGSNYYGFQRLKDNRTVQGDFEKALTKINKKPTHIKGAGRTDRGVHAYNQMIHFDLDIEISPEALTKALNSCLAKGIYVNYCEKKSDSFHSRFEVKKKIYEYKINTGTYDPILDRHFYNYNRKLNLKKIKEASKFLIGRQSYEAFVCGKRDNYDSEVYDIKIKEKNNILTITFIGQNFYQYMIRNMVGSLIMVGEEKIKPICVKEMLEQKKNLYHYANAPAEGLYLMNIEY